MSTIQVYRGQELVDSQSFLDEFYIVYDSDADILFWDTGEEQKDLKRRGGEIHIWIQKSLDLKPQIAFIRPDWQVILNGIPLGQKFYGEFEIGQENIELRYKHYRFMVIP